MPTDGIKYIDIKEFAEAGYLQEVNRQFLHPLGLALEARYDEDGRGWVPADLQAFLVHKGFESELAEKMVNDAWPVISALGLDRAHLGGIWDYRDDPEGMCFAGMDLIPKAERVEAARQAMRRTREPALGYMVQPADNIDMNLMNMDAATTRAALAAETGADEDPPVGEGEEPAQDA